MTSSLLLMLSVFMAPGWPNVRVDHQNLPTHILCYCAIAVGPGAPSSPPLYVVFQDDSCSMGVRADIWFQKSTDGGRTWLAEDLLIRRGNRYAHYPDITTDSDGNVFIIHLDTDGASTAQVFCVNSSDGGTTWSAPARVNDDSLCAIGSATIAADSAGNLFCAWNDWRTGSGHIWSSVSIDQGATWGRNVQVDDDTTNYDCYQRDAFVQPGTNHYLVAAEAPRWFGGHIIPCAFLYRSTDRGQTFQPGVQLDTFNWAAWSPHVVADRDHIICDYFGSTGFSSPLLAESRTFYTQRDTWGVPHSVTTLDSLHELYYSGPLAISGDGGVHTALMVGNATGSHYNTFYTSSSDHGVSWSDPELINKDTTARTWYPDIGADSTGHAYVVWEDFDGERGTIWFSTNSPAGIAEEPMRQPISVQTSATVVRGVLVLGGNGDSPSGRVDARYSPHFPVMSRAALLDISGREVMELHSGVNDVRALAPGVYFVREAQAQAQAIRKVVVTR
jgi:hypothetical protein